MILNQWLRMMESVGFFAKGYFIQVLNCERCLFYYNCSKIIDEYYNYVWGVPEYLLNGGIE